ncbi:MAG: hypothetical protein ACREHV_06030 [Rhizomicrobium sp.]
MSNQHAKETLGFNNFSGYYGSVTQGYGGLDYSDVDYLNATYWENDKTAWCDTGFQSVIHGAGEAFTQGPPGQSSYGFFETPNLNETFSLTSMVAASAWETNQPFEFISYTYKHGKGFVEKAMDTVYLSQTAQTIDFAKISGGNPGDFKNVAAVLIVSKAGAAGNTCTYGAAYPTYGNQMAFDNLKVKWNGKIPHGGEGSLVTKGLRAHLQHRAAHAAAQLGSAGHHEGPAHEHAAGSVHHADGNGYHTQLLSLGHDPHGLTGQFHLPAVEHFGP